MIKIENLVAGYCNNIVLNGISLSVSKGEIISIIGPNGCGKSTLLRCIAKQNNIVSGNIYIDGDKLDKYTSKQFAKKISYLMQAHNTSSINIEGLVSHGRFPYLGFPRKLSEADKSIVKNAMLRVGVFGIRQKELSSLSGGECQKAYLAMALAQNSDILLLDEPTTYLDIKYQLELFQLLVELKNEGKTIIIVLHDINSALAIADKIALISKGKLAYCGVPTEIGNKGVIERVFGVHTKSIKLDDEPFIRFYI